MCIFFVEPFCHFLSQLFPHTHTHCCLPTHQARLTLDAAALLFRFALLNGIHFATTLVVELTASIQNIRHTGNVHS